MKVIYFMVGLVIVLFLTMMVLFSIKSDLKDIKQKQEVIITTLNNWELE